MSNRKPDTKVRIDVDLEDYYRIKDGKIIITRDAESVALLERVAGRIAASLPSGQ